MHLCPPPPRDSIFIANFPDRDQLEGKCQVLAKDDEEEKYLLVCSIDPETKPSFYFYSDKNKPVDVSQFQSQESEKDKMRVTFKTFNYGDGVATSGIYKEESILIPPTTWIDVLMGAGFSSCVFKGEKKINVPWIINCTKEDTTKETIKKDIYLTPLIFKD